MKHALPTLLALLLSSAASGACPEPAAWARTFYERHYFFYAGPPQAAVLALSTPAFGRALRAEARYANGEVGHLDYDPWLGAQDGEIAKTPRLVFTAASTGPSAARVSMTYRFVLDNPRAGTPQTVRLLLRRDGPGACWRLDDFITPLGESLQHVFTQT